MKNLALCAAAVAAAGSAFADPRFFEDFKNYCDAAPGVVADAAVTFGNDPIRALRAEVNVRSDKNLLLYTNAIAIPQGGKFDVAASFRFLNSEEAKESAPAAPAFFDLVLEGGGKTQPIRFAADAVAGAAIPWIPNSQWREFVVKADGAKADVYVTADRRFDKVATVKLDFPCETVNFAAAAGRFFSLTDIRVSAPEPLPAHPAAAHFASFASLDKHFEDGVVSAGESVVVCPGENGGFRLVAGADSNRVSGLTFTWADGKTDYYPVKAEPQVFKLPMAYDGHAKGDVLELGDSVVSIGKNFLKFYVRPWLRPYCNNGSTALTPFGLDILREWNSLPKASAHVLDVDFVRDGGKVDVYLDGSYAKTLSRPDGVALRDIVLSPAKGVRYALRAGGDADEARFQRLDLARRPRARAFATAAFGKGGVAPGETNLFGVAMTVARPADSADIGLCHQDIPLWALAYDEFFGRDPAGNFPSAIHHRLKAAPYCRAHLLVAFDTDKAKDRFLTVRLSRYAERGVGNNMIGQSTTDFAGTAADGLVKVGEIRRGGEVLPLYYAKVNLPLGEVTDFASRGDFIDFEFSGKPWENFEQVDNTRKPDPAATSAVNIFAVTLEKAPVSLDVAEAAPGNVFTEDEKERKTIIRLKAVVDGAAGSLAWRATDVSGRQVLSRSRKFALAKAGDTLDVEVDFGRGMPRGYYDLVFDVLDAGGERLFSHAGSFAILPRAGRLADKFKSPYGTWWFSAHGSPADYAIGGPLVQKAGIRRITWNPPDQEQAEKYGVTGNGSLKIPPMRDFDAATGMFKPKQVPDPSDPEKNAAKKRKIEIDGEAAFVADLRGQIDKLKARGLPYGYALLWHESAPHGDIPEELLGLPVPEVTDKDRDTAAYVNECGRLMRKHFPGVKIQLGNSGASLGAVTKPLRAGAKAEYYDQVGIENAAQVIPSERLIDIGLQSAVIAKEAASLLAGRAIPVAGCWEFTYRCDRDMGDRKHAEWYVRDLLVSLAHRMPLIAPGIFFDCTNGYYDGPWGASGILRRAPYCYPKRAYVGYAVLTYALDGVELVRQIPTGSTTVYALEFRRADGKYATAIWSARGAFELEVDSPGKGTQIKMYGAESAFKAGRQVVCGSTEPSYLVTDAPLAGIRVAGRSFPEDEALASRAVVAAPLDGIGDLSLAPDRTMASRQHGFLPILKASDFTLAAVEDDEKGKCIEVALDLSKNAETSKYVTEYTTVRLAKPVPLEGEPALIGVWVKGNSNWGQIRFEIEDARGEVFKNLSTGSAWGCDVMDWPGNLAVNFDGWSYVYQTLKPNALIPTHSPGPYSEQWVSEGGDKKIDFPVKLRAITIGMNRQKLDLTDFAPSVPAIRLRDAGGICE